MQLTVITIVVIYLLAMLAIGYYSSKKISSNEDFMVAGRNLGPFLMAGTLAATEIGGGSSLGVVEKAYGQWGLGAGSIFGNDIYKIYIKPSATSNEVMKVTQWTMVLVGVLGWGIAMTNTGNLITLLMFSFTLRAAGAFFPYVFGLYWKKSSLAGTIASLISGSIVVIILENTKIELWGLEPILPGLVVSFISFILLSILMPSDRNDCSLLPEE